MTPSRSYLEVIAEDIRDKAKIMGDGYKVLNEKLDRKFGEAEARFDKFEQQTNSNFKTVFDYLSRIDDELKDIKNEIKKLKEELKNKADLDRLETLEIRVTRIEGEMAHR